MIKPQQLGQPPGVDLVTLVAFPHGGILSRIAHQQFCHVRFQQVVQPRGRGSAQPSDKLQNHARFRFDDTFHHHLPGIIPDGNRNTFLVNVHADIFSAGHKGVPFWRGSSRTLKTLLQNGRPFIMRRVIGHVVLSPLIMSLAKLIKPVSRLIWSRVERSTLCRNPPSQARWLSPKQGELMFMHTRLGFVLVVSLLGAVAALSQQDSSPTQPVKDMVFLDVVVTPKSGGPVSGLQQQDFTVLDNKIPVTLSSFQALRGRETPIEVVLVIDDVNTGVEHVAYERSEIDKFLRADGGHLAHPMALAFLTDAGIKIQDSFSSDGNALSTALDQYTVGLHSIARSSGIYGAAERFDISLRALHELADREAARPGRKLIVWFSPGWPLLSGPGVEEQMTAKQEQQIFDNVVNLSTLLRQGRITLYSIDPLGSADFAGRAFRWGFVKGVSKPSQAEWGDVALQVIAVQSGGLALNTGNDINAFLQACLADTQAYYELSFAPSVDQKRNEYHHLEIRVAKAGVVARTRQGYYS
jgi:VWFA-related protein